MALSKRQKPSRTTNNSDVVDNTKDENRIYYNGSNSSVKGIIKNYHPSSDNLSVLPNQGVNIEESSQSNTSIPAQEEIASTLAC